MNNYWQCYIHRISHSDFDALKTNIALSTEDMDCYAVKEAHFLSLYGLMGYTVKAITKADISPSITHLIKKVIIRIKYKNFPQMCKNRYQDWKGYYDIPLTCDADISEYFTQSTYKNGVVDAACFPNSKIPTSNKCVAGDDKAFLKGYKTFILYGWDESGWIMATSDGHIHEQQTSVEFDGKKFTHATVFFDNVSETRVALSVIAAATVLPAIAFFF
ncbi:MAG: hypothetical protein EZS28_018564 [Streblomastix strix]|uniref:Uncharacterized protein n=1 Tax=Streblomastix strix TaxID=222440 RepID=A0A5J4VU12_9EUKA|nr:MAG: hypothetical protein EZS28_018564 [Streblomastix strix]